jgi:hypothetical protein
LTGDVSSDQLAGRRHNPSRAPQGKACGRPFLAPQAAEGAVALRPFTTLATLTMNVLASNPSQQVESDSPPLVNPPSIQSNRIAL